MFAKNNRLRKTKEIDLVFKQGKSAFEKALGIKTKKNDLSNTKITVLVSVKVSKKAVERNLLKRRIRAALRENISNFKGSYDLVVVTQPSAKNLDYVEIQQTIKKLLKKLKII
jgi:ribonuclease P protein component